MTNGHLRNQERTLILDQVLHFGRNVPQHRHTRGATMRDSRHSIGEVALVAGGAAIDVGVREVVGLDKLRPAYAENLTRRNAAVRLAVVVSVDRIVSRLDQLLVNRGTQEASPIFLRHVLLVQRGVRRGDRSDQAGRGISHVLASLNHSPAVAATHSRTRTRRQGHYLETVAVKRLRQRITGVLGVLGANLKVRDCLVDVRHESVSDQCIVKRDYPLVGRDTSTHKLHAGGMVSGTALPDHRELRRLTARNATDKLAAPRHRLGPELRQHKAGEQLQKQRTCIAVAVYLPKPAGHHISHLTTLLLECERLVLQ